MKNKLLEDAKMLIGKDEVRSFAIVVARPDGGVSMAMQGDAMQMIGALEVAKMKVLATKIEEVK